MAILLHGTTRQRAERIIAEGPDPSFMEPGQSGARAEGFSTYFESGPFLFGTPEEYAHVKARLFPAEGGPAILRVDVPEEIIEKALNPWFPRSQGLIQFDEGSGLDQLRAAWPSLPKQIVPVEPA